MITAALVILVVAAACFMTRVVIGPSLADRVVALDGLVVTLVVGIILDAIRRDAAWFLDAALVVAFVGFVGTVAGGRFIQRRGG